MKELGPTGVGGPVNLIGVCGARPNCNSAKAAWPQDTRPLLTAHSAMGRRMLSQGEMNDCRSDE